MSYCAAIRSSLRWCITGTPFSNALFDLFGQLAFLGLIGADDVGRAGLPRVIPALHFRGIYNNCLPSEYNSTAEVVASILKPLIVRHSKNQERSGARLLCLDPIAADTKVRLLHISVYIQSMFSVQVSLN